jgi:hypothetical protein
MLGLGGKESWRSDLTLTASAQVAVSPTGRRRPAMKMPAADHLVLAGPNS